MLSFTVPAAIEVGSAPQGMVAGDFNGDSQPDLAVPNLFSNDVSVLLGKPDGTFHAAQSFSALSSGSNSDWHNLRSVAVGDLNQDGNLDLVTANYNFDSNDLSVLLGNGDGTFQQPQSLSLPDQYDPGYGQLVPQQPLEVAVGDLNGDGSLDLVATGRSAGILGTFRGM